MTSYIAHDKKSGLVYQGGLNQVAEWSRLRIQNKAPKAVIAIIKCRPESDGRVIAEFTYKGGQIIENGRTLNQKDILKLCKRAKDG